MEANLKTLMDLGWRTCFHSTRQYYKTGIWRSGRKTKLRLQASWINEFLSSNLQLPYKISRVADIISHHVVKTPFFPALMIRRTGIRQWSSGVKKKSSLDPDLQPLHIPSRTLGQDPLHHETHRQSPSVPRTTSCACQEHCVHWSWSNGLRDGLQPLLKEICRVA